MTLALGQSVTSPRARLFAVLDRLEDEAAFDIGLRTSMRRAVYAPITLGVLAGGYKPLYRGWATDLSLSGLGLLVEHDIPMGAVLHINLETIAGEELLLPIRICYVSQLMSKTYRIGGTFEFADDKRQHQPRLFA
ncbi:MAG: PilZ domain-containing protein [Phycisphaerales bacterium]